MEELLFIVSIERAYEKIWRTDENSQEALCNELKVNSPVRAVYWNIRLCRGGDNIITFHVLDVTLVDALEHLGSNVNPAIGHVLSEYVFPVTMDASFRLVALYGKFKAAKSVLAGVKGHDRGN